MLRCRGWDYVKARCAHGSVSDLKIQLEDEVCLICKRRAAKAAKADAGNQEAREGGSDLSNPPTMIRVHNAMLAVALAITMCSDS